MSIFVGHKAVAERAKFVSLFSGKIETFVGEVRKHSNNRLFGFRVEPMISISHLKFETFLINQH